MANDTFFRAQAPIIMRRLIAELPWSVSDAAACVGNLGYESGGFKQLQEKHPLVPGSRGGFGIAQWTGDRRVKFEQYCKTTGLDPTGMEANTGWLLWELKNSEKAAVPRTKAASALHDKVVAFERAFERADLRTVHYDQRDKWAQIALESYTPGTIVDANAPKAPVDLPVPPAVPKTTADVKHAGGVVGTAGGAMAAIYTFMTSWAFLACVGVVVAAAVWWFLVRPVLVRYNALGDVEATFLSKVAAAIKGIRTKLFSAVLAIAGIAAPFISWATDSNLLDMLPTIKGIPGSMYGTGILAVIAYAMNALRNASNTTAGQTDLSVLTPVAPMETQAIQYYEMSKPIKRRVSQTKKRRQSHKKKAAHHGEPFGKKAA